MGVIVVAGAAANKCGNGGGAWERMSWAVGFRRLGFDVYFVEQIAPEACADAGLAWFRSVTGWFGLAGRAALVSESGEQCAGLPWHRLLQIAESADLLVNLSGHLT